MDDFLKKLLGNSVGRAGVILLINTILLFLLVLGAKLSKKKAVFRGLCIVLYNIVLSEFIYTAIIAFVNYNYQKWLVGQFLVMIFLGLLQSSVIYMSYCLFQKAIGVNVGKNLLNSMVVKKGDLFPIVKSLIFPLIYLVVFIAARGRHRIVLEPLQIVNLVVLTPIIEEFIFRFSIPQMLKKEKLALGYIFILSIVFALLHPADAKLFALFFSMYVYSVYNKIGKLSVTIIIHSISNFVYVYWM